MGAHCYYDLKIEIVRKQGKKIITNCEWEDNDYIGALKHPDIKKKLAMVTNGSELAQAIEQAYRDEQDRLTPVSSLRECTLDWSGDNISSVDSFADVVQINLTEETHDLFGGGKPSKKSIKITNTQNPNLKKQTSKAPAKKKMTDAEGTETVTIKIFKEIITAERSMKDSKRKKVYSRTCADICEVFSCAVKINATPDLMKYALESCTAEIQRQVSIRYVTSQLEVSDDAKTEIDKMIRKHRKKILETLIAQNHADGIKYVLSICKSIKSSELNDYIAMSKELEFAEVTECLYDYLNHTDPKN